MAKMIYSNYSLILKILWFSLCLFAQTLQPTSALYEDQVGKFDWRHQFIGRVDSILRSSDLWQDHQSLIVSTKSGVLSGLHLRNGSLHWRHILEHENVNYLASGFTSKAHGFDCPILTINNFGRWIRCWSNSGILLLEQSLNNEFLVEIEANPLNFQLLFHTTFNEHNEPGLKIAKISYSTYTIELYQYDFKFNQLQSFGKFSAGKWLNTKSSCQLITSKYLVCPIQESLELQVLYVSNKGSQFKRFPLASFGLKSEQKPKFLTVQFLPCQEEDKTVTISKSNEKGHFFAVNLGGDGFVLLKIHQDIAQSGPHIDLIKILPRAVKLTIIPLIASGPESQSSPDVPVKEEFGLAVLFSKQEALPYQDPSEGQNNEKVFALKLAIFNLKTWAEIASMSSNQILLEFGSKSPISPIVSNGKLAKRLDKQWFISLFEIIPVKTITVNSRNGRNQFRYTYKMVLGTEDGTLILLSLMGKVNWAREEALSEIASLVMLDLPLSENEATLEQEYGLDQNSKNVILLFTNRINSQLSQLNSAIRSLYQWMFSFGKNNPKKIVHNSKQLDESLEISDSVSSTSDEQSIDQNEVEEEESFVRDYFGLRKVIVVFTKVGKIFAIDSMSGRVIWSKYEPSLRINGNQAKFPIWVQRTSAHYPHSAVCTFLIEPQMDKQESILYSFEPFNGNLIERKTLPFVPKQAMMIQNIQDQNFCRPILILDENLQVSLYPDTSTTRELFAKVAPNYYMMISNRTSGELTGFSFSKSDSKLGPNAYPVWSFRLPQENDKIVDIKTIFKRPTEHVHSQGRVLGDRNVLYKYLNPNLVAVLCESVDNQDKYLISLYLLDSITGNIIYSIVHKRARGPIQIVHSENWIIYSYYNDKMRRNEISSIELYEGFHQINSTAFSSIGRDLLALPIVEQKSFIFPTGIGIMMDTETQKGITNKHILISLPTGGLLELPRAFLDPRRPIKPTQEQAEEGLIPYVPELPIPSETMINYNQTIMSIKGIQTAPTTLESTSLVFAYGLDIYYTKVTPSKTFDILKDDFDHLLIMAVLAMLIIFSYLAKLLAARKSLNAAWK